MIANIFRAKKCFFVCKALLIACEKGTMGAKVMRYVNAFITYGNEAPGKHHCSPFMDEGRIPSHSFRLLSGDTMIWNNQPANVGHAPVILPPLSNTPPR